MATMTDLMPLFTFVVSTGVSIACVVTLVRGRGKIESAARRWVLVGAQIVLIGLPYLAFASAQGDADVWDFYRSFWWVPLAILGTLSAIGIVSAVRRDLVAPRRTV